MKNIKKIKSNIGVIINIVPSLCPNCIYGDSPDYIIWYSNSNKKDVDSLIIDYLTSIIDKNCNCLGCWKKRNDLLED